jgi:hypothetical protein
MDLQQFATNCETLNPWEVLMPVLEKYLPEMEKDNRDNLWDGKTSLGANITPTYLTDPYFKSQKQAMGYAKWKSSPGYMKDSSRSFETPNLYIDGTFYREINAVVTSLGIEFNAETSLGSAIQAKFGNKVLGITDEDWKPISEKVIPEYIDALLQKLLN